MISFGLMPSVLNCFHALLTTRTLDKRSDRIKNRPMEVTSWGTMNERGIITDPSFV